MRWPERDLHLLLQKATNRTIDDRVRTGVQNTGRIWEKGPAFSDGRRGGVYCGLALRAPVSGHKKN